MRFWVGVLAIAALAVPALAEDKIIRLKNGRKVVGEILEETKDSYIVKTTGGKTSIPKSTVVKVEDAPPPPKPFLDPATPPTAPASEAPVSSPTVVPPREAPERAPEPVGPPTVNRGPLASAMEIAAARKELLLVPAASAPEARRLAKADVASRTSLGALVAILAEPTNALHPTPPPERLVALEVVQEAGPGIHAYLARAVASVDLEKGTPNELFQAIESIGPSDKKGMIEAALMSRIGESMGTGSPEAYAKVLARVGTAGSLPKLFEWILTVDGAAPLAEAAWEIVGRSENPDGALRLLATAIDPARLPNLKRLGTAVEGFGLSKGDHVLTLERIVGALDRMPGNTDSDQVTSCVRKTCDALVKIGTAEARGALVRFLESARAPERRIATLGSIRNIVFASEDERVEVLRALVQRMDDIGLGDEEKAAFVSTLEWLSSKKFGADVAAWRAYLNLDK